MRTAARRTRAPGATSEFCDSSFGYSSTDGFKKIASKKRSAVLQQASRGSHGPSITDAHGRSDPDPTSRGDRSGRVVLARAAPADHGRVSMRVGCAADPGRARAARTPAFRLRRARVV